MDNQSSRNMSSNANKKVSRSKKEEAGISAETLNCIQILNEAKMVVNIVPENSNENGDKSDKLINLKTETECHVNHNCRSWLQCSEHPDFKTYNDIFSDEMLQNYIKKKIQRSAEEENQLECEVCTKTFHSKADLKRHLTKHYEENPTVCIGNNDISHVDLRITESNLKISQHLLTHGLELVTDPDSRIKLNGKTKKPCAICSKDIVDCYMRNHLLKHVGVWNVECAVCLESYEDGEDLLQHFDIHTDRSSCFVCGEDIRILKYDLQCHLLVHAAAYPLNCLDCELTFFNTEDIKKHTFSRHKPNSYFCDICDRGFLNNFEYLRHLLTHLKHLEASCSNCNKLLEDHFDIFEEVSKMQVETRFNCSECHIAFSHYTHLRQHQIQHVVKFFSCETCNKTFNRKINLDKHELVHSAEYIKDEVDLVNGLVEFEEPFQDIMEVD